MQCETFHIDSRSGVAPYRQIVQQVRQALRLGLLDEGDQLPTVKDVVAQVVINPTTVLKAYRELEHESLAAGRPGLGTFVTRSLDGSSLAGARGHANRSRPLAHRSAAASRPGRRQHRGALREHVSRRGQRGHRMTAIEATNLGKRYGRHWALRTAPSRCRPGASSASSARTGQESPPCSISPSACSTPLANVRLCRLVWLRQFGRVLIVDVRAGGIGIGALIVVRIARVGSRFR